MHTACKDTKIQWCIVAPEWSDRKVSLASCLQTKKGSDRSENETVDLQVAEEG